MTATMCLTISLHQEGNYPLDTGRVRRSGRRGRTGYKTSTFPHAGAGHTGLNLHAFDHRRDPWRSEAFAPDMIIVACGL